MLRRATDLTLDKETPNPDHGLVIRMRLILAATMAYTNSILAGVIGPADFKDLALRSVNILETYNAYQSAFEEKRAKQFDSTSGELVNQKNTLLFFADLTLMAPLISAISFKNMKRVLMSSPICCKCM